jgi:pimeloyl-ACP methyl ester carboxylesterase
VDDAFPTKRTLRVGEIDILVAEAGSGPPVVLLHGNPDTHTVWSGVVARLANRHRCIAPDLPGFGGSPPPAGAEPYSLASQAAFVRDLFAALELSSAHLVVHDVGGTYGLAFACDHADKLRTLTICNTNFFTDYRWHFWARVWRTRVLGEMAMGIANRPLFVREVRRGSPRIPVEYARHAYAGFNRPTKRHVLRWYRAMDPSVHEGWTDRMLATVAKVPAQVIWGELDPFIPATHADRFGGAAVHRFADCGHHAMVEEPERTAELIGALAAKH